MSHHTHYEKDIITSGGHLGKEGILTASHSGMGAAAGAGEYSRDYKETTSTTMSHGGSSHCSGIAPGAELHTGTYFFYFFLKFSIR